jgi:hypothetical protein
MRVRLIRKLADQLDGVDLSGHEIGDVFDLPSVEAGILVAEEWATPERREPAVRSGSLPAVGSPAPDPCSKCGSDQGKVALATEDAIYYRCLTCQHGWSESFRRTFPATTHIPE